MSFEWFPIIKTLHVTAVTLSFSGFLVRIIWRWTAPERLDSAWARRLPHVNDTLLLVSGLTLATLAHVSPLERPWLAVKLTALVVYVITGSIALRRGRTLQGRLVAFALASAVFAYMVAVAITRRVIPWS